MKRRTPRHRTNIERPHSKTPAEEFAHYYEGDPPLLEDAHVGMYVYLEYRLKTSAEFDVSLEADYLNMPADEIFELLKRLEAVELISLPDKKRSDWAAIKRLACPFRIQVLPPLNKIELGEKRAVFLKRISDELRDT